MIPVAGNLTNNAPVDAGEIADAVTPDRRTLASLSGASPRMDKAPKMMALHSQYIPSEHLARRCFLLFSPCDFGAGAKAGASFVHTPMRLSLRVSLSRASAPSCATLLHVDSWTDTRPSAVFIIWIR